MAMAETIRRGPLAALPMAVRAQAAMIGRAGGTLKLDPHANDGIVQEADALIEAALGASSVYVAVGGLAASGVDPGVANIDYVAKHIAASGKDWEQGALVAGIALRAFVSMRLSDARRQAISPIWRRALGTANPAARHADGCTSSHGLSGTAQLAVSSTIAVAAMVAGGIAAAHLLLRRI